MLVNYWLDNTIFCNGRKITCNTKPLIVISNLLLLLLESVSSWFFFYKQLRSCTQLCVLHTVSNMWGKYGATCLAHGCISVLTLFSNKKVVHSIKSLFMLQEMAAKNSAFWSALKTPLHGWHFSSIFPQTYLVCRCSVTCSTCLWTICSANQVSMCYSKV